MNNLTIRDAKIIFRNFAGKGSQYNPEGRRNFSVVIEDEDLANRLMSDGWNLKPLKKRDDNDPQHWHLPVAVNFGIYPPTITTISGDIKIALDEESVNRLDWAEIIKVDLTIRPRTYSVGGRDGIKAYLKTMYVTLEVDELAAEYESDLPFDS